MKSTIRLCLVGAGRVAHVHADSLVNHVQGAELVAVVDNDPQALSRLADEFGIDGRFESLDRAIDAASFDAVVITTPTFTHAELAVQAASAVKHVFVEKPMALDLRECDAIERAAVQYNVLLQLGFMRRFSPEFVAAAERIQGGEIGRPMLMKSLTHGPGLPPPWAREMKTSNGNLAEVNSHDWDSIRWLMRSNYHRVYAEVANLKGAALGVDSENFYDTALVSIMLESGSLGSISSVCPCTYGYDARVEIIGDKGIMLIGDLQGERVIACTDRDHGLVTPIWRTWPDRFRWGYIREMEHFVDCIRIGHEPAVGAAEGRWAVAGVLAATKSFTEERPVYLTEVLG